MLVLYIGLLLNAKEGFSSLREKVIPKGRDLGNDNRTLLLNPKTTQGTVCPAVDPDTTACLTAHTAIGTAVTADTAVPLFEPIVNTYLGACKASQCQTACVTLIPRTGATITSVANFGADFATGCTLPTALSTLGVTCPTTTPNGATCTTLYNEVLTAVRAATWVPATIKEKVDLFTAGCLTTSCLEDCKGVVSGANVVSPYSSFETKFVASCNPDKKPDDDGKKEELGYIDIKLNLMMMFIVAVTSSVFYLLNW
jgi:hypothetical protein